MNSSGGKVTISGFMLVLAFTVMITLTACGSSVTVRLPNYKSPVNKISTVTTLDYNRPDSDYIVVDDKVLQEGFWGEYAGKYISFKSKFQYITMGGHEVKKDVNSKKGSFRSTCSIYTLTAANKKMPDINYICDDKEVAMALTDLRPMDYITFQAYVLPAQSEIRSNTNKLFGKHSEPYIILLKMKPMKGQQVAP